VCFVWLLLSLCIFHTVGTSQPALSSSSHLLVRSFVCLPLIIFMILVIA